MKISHWVIQVFSIIVLCATLSCKRYIQVFQTESDLTVNENGLYVFETDSVKVLYSFWREKGLVSFSIENKLKVPIYVDWKKSSYIDNSVKLNYWTNEITSVSASKQNSYLYNGPLIAPNFVFGSSTISTISKSSQQERTTFIPPSSTFAKSNFYILPIGFLSLDKNTPFYEMPRSDKRSKTTCVFIHEYDRNTTPLSFRNFLTLSTDEEFETEFYIDNGFYVSRVEEMDERHLTYYKFDPTKDGRWFIRDENDIPIKFSDYKQPSAFYLNIPSTESVEKRR
jgi:hypothetical protein